MTLTSVLIRDAYRESNLIAISADPTAAEQEEGLRLLNSFLASVYGTEVGEQLDPIVIGRNNINRPQGYPWYDEVPPYTDWFVPQNARLILNITSPQTVYLDPNPEDGARFAIQDKSSNLATYNFTVYGNGRTIQDNDSVVFSTNDTNSEYIYRRDTGNWSIVTPLEADDPFPFPVEFDPLFSIGLAFRLNPRNGVEAAPETSAMYTRLLKMFKARYRQHQQMGSELGLVRTLGNGNRYNDDTRFANSLFNSGYASLFGGYRW